MPRFLPLWDIIPVSVSSESCVQPCSWQHVWEPEHQAWHWQDAPGCDEPHLPTQEPPTTWTPHVSPACHAPFPPLAWGSVFAWLIRSFSTISLCSAPSRWRESSYSLPAAVFPCPPVLGNKTRRLKSIEYSNLYLMLMTFLSSEVSSAMPLLQASSSTSSSRPDPRGGQETSLSLLDISRALLAPSTRRTHLWWACDTLPLPEDLREDCRWGERRGWAHLVTFPVTQETSWSVLR